jgi:uncharacterized protein (DUF58 family)
MNLTYPAGRPASAQRVRVQLQRALHRYETQLRPIGAAALRAARVARDLFARYLAPPLRVLTGAGRGVLLGAIAAWLVGAHFGWLELTVAATAGLVSVLLCVAFVIGHAPVRVDVRPQRRRVEAGESVRVTVELTNRAQRMLLPVGLELAVGPIGDQRPVPVPAPRLRRDQSVIVDDDDFPPIAADRRGVILIGPATTVRADPLGLLRRTVQWPEVKELIVYPRTIALHPLGAGLLHDLEGRTDEQISPSDLDFHTLRDYVRGDDRRHIHWRSSARVGSLAPGSQRFLVRQFLQTHSTHLMIAVDGDTASYADPDQFETAISAAASVGRRAIADRIGVTIVVADRQVRDLTDEAALFDACARAQFGSGGDFGALVARGAGLAPHTSVALLVTGPIADGARLRQVRGGLRPEVAVNALRVDPAKRTGIVSGSAMNVYTLAQLPDLRALLASGGVR